MGKLIQWVQIEFLSTGRTISKRILKKQNGKVSLTYLTHNMDQESKFVSVRHNVTVQTHSILTSAWDRGEWLDSSCHERTLRYRLKASRYSFWYLLTCDRELFRGFTASVTTSRDGFWNFVAFKFLSTISHISYIVVIFTVNKNINNTKYKKSSIKVTKITIFGIVIFIVYSSISFPVRLPCKMRP